jgi:hypothetical protein
LEYVAGENPTQVIERIGVAATDLLKDLARVGRFHGLTVE